MKNVLIFSSLYTTKKLSERINKLLETTNRGVAYIAASYGDDATLDLHSEMQLYEMGFREGLSFPIGSLYRKENLDDLFDSAAIYLGGGNTFEFLFMLQLRGLLKPLRNYVKNGGIIMGTSAGGIMMCEDIGIANFADDNYLALKDLTGLGLVDFLVKPHWESWVKESGAFRRYSDKTGKKIFGLCECQSIWVTDNGIKFYGGMPDVIWGDLVGK